MRLLQQRWRGIGACRKLHNHSQRGHGLAVYPWQLHDYLRHRTTYGKRGDFDDHRQRPEQDFTGMDTFLGHNGVHHQRIGHWQWRYGYRRDLEQVLARWAGATVGNYSIVPTLAVGSGLGNYTINYLNGLLTVNKATPTVTVIVGTYTYNGSPQGPSSVTTSTIDNGAVTYSYAGNGEHDLLGEFHPAQCGGHLHGDRDGGCGCEQQ